MANSSYGVMAILAAVALLLVWLEWKRASRRNLFFRVTAVLLALCAAGYLLFFTTQSDPFSTKAILVTPGAEDVRDKTQKVFSVEEYLASGDTSVKSWKVSGFGLTANELQVIRPLITQHTYALPAAGIASASWQQVMQPGSDMRWQGHVFNHSDKPVKLSLEAYAVVQDSIVIPPGAGQDITLHAKLRHTGQALFRIKLEKGSTVLENNPVPVMVATPKYLRLLVLASSPDFEYRFLQRWLGENGFGALVRTRTSRDKYQQVFVNQRSFPFSRLNSQVLDSFDLVVADGTALQELGEAELDALRRQVAGNGLGLLVRADTALPAAKFYSGGFRFQTIIPRQPQQVTPVLFPGGESLAALPLSQYLAIEPGQRQQPLVTEKGGLLLSAAGIYGGGRIAVATLPGSFQWLLSGNEPSYAAYWTRLFTQVARRQPADGYAPLMPGMYTQGEAVPVTWVNENVDSLVLRLQDTLPMTAVPDAAFPHIWQAAYWPQRAGWQSVGDGRTVQWQFIYRKEEWPVVQAYRRINDTREWMNRHPARGGTDDGAMNDRNALWPLLLFLFSVSFLWVERKFLS